MKLPLSMAKLAISKAAVAALALAAVPVGVARAEVPAAPTADWRPSQRWRGFNLLGMFRAPSIGLSDPLDYRILIRGDSWTNLDENALVKLDQAIEWGRKWGVHVQIAMHRIPGFCILDQTEAFPLGTSPVAQAAAAEIWRRMARRWKGIPNEALSFNLFNEPIRHVAGTNYVKVARLLVDAIRAEDSRRFIMVDGNDCASVPVPEFYGVPAVGQSFRGYTPKLVTHYRSTFIPTPEEPPTWPLAPGYASGGLRASPESSVAQYQGALDAGEFCMVGEFGCCSTTPHATALAWMEHCLKLWKAKGLGWALWNLRGRFGILDSGREDVAYDDFRGHKLDRKMLELLRRY